MHLKATPFLRHKQGARGNGLHWFDALRAVKRPGSFFCRAPLFERLLLRAARVDRRVHAQDWRCVPIDRLDELRDESPQQRNVENVQVIGPAGCSMRDVLQDVVERGSGAAVQVGRAGEDRDLCPSTCR